MPFFTIFTPTYNRAYILPQLYQSLCMQTCKDFEWLIIDDGSTDESGKICDQYSEIDSRIHVIHKKNGGLSDARNVGLDYAVGEYIFFRRQ